MSAIATLRRIRRFRWATPLAAALVIMGNTCQPTKPPPTQTQSEAFACTGGVQQWTVPAGVTEAVFDVLGAEGGATTSTQFNVGTPGGAGGHARATIPVAPGETLLVKVGCAGESRGNTTATNTHPAGGFPNGGNGGVWVSGGGGGGSEVDRGGARLIVAGGGGGAGGNVTAGNSAGGAGGGPSGTKGGDGIAGVIGGGGGTQSAGGSAGASTGGAAQSGTNTGFGGAGGDNLSNQTSGGGGGGGYFGGGGGGADENANMSAGAGGGGSGFGPADTFFETGVRSGDGVVIVTWTPSA